MNARRGDVWLVNLDPIEGHEQAGTRPALVVSVDSFNASRTQLVTVLPMTIKARPNNPLRIEVRPPEGDVREVSYVIGEQPRTVSTSRLEQRFGAVSPGTMFKAADVMRVLLGL